MDRIDEIDEEVDFLPLRPPDDRLYEDRGVNGAGDTDGLLPDP